jgi:hypothetical protein
MDSASNRVLLILKPAAAETEHTVLKALNTHAFHVLHVRFIFRGAASAPYLHFPMIARGMRNDNQTTE